MIFVSCTVNSCDFTVHALKKKKKKKKKKNAETEMRKTRNPNGYIDFQHSRRFLVVPFQPS